MKNNETRVYEKMLICLVIISTFLLGLLFVCIEKQAFSERELRRLAKAPDLSFASFADGSFAEQLNEYTADHFPLRRHFVSAHTVCELLLGKRQANSVILARDRALCPRGDGYDNETVSENAAAIAEFLASAKSKGASVTVGIIPEKIDAYVGSLPFGYESERVTNGVYEALNEHFREAGHCNFRNLFSGRGDEVYYKTDHHWNARGAFEAYLEICRSLGITPYPEESFGYEAASDSFFGTSSSRFGLHIARDVIYLPRFDGDWQFLCRAGDRELNGFYDFSALEGEDKYRVFLGGNSPIVKITLSDREQSRIRPTMLIFRDSYTSAIAPYLARHFNLVLCDPRYYKGIACDIAEESQARYVLVLLGIGELERSTRLADFFDLP